MSELSPSLPLAFRPRPDNPRPRPVRRRQPRATFASPPPRCTWRDTSVPRPRAQAKPGRQQNARYARSGNGRPERSRIFFPRSQIGFSALPLPSRTRMLATRISLAQAAFSALESSREMDFRGDRSGAIKQRNLLGASQRGHERGDPRPCGDSFRRPTRFLFRVLARDLSEKKIGDALEGALGAMLWAEAGGEGATQGGVPRRWLRSAVFGSRGEALSAPCGRAGDEARSTERPGLSLGSVAGKFALEK